MQSTSETSTADAGYDGPSNSHGPPKKRRRTEYGRDNLLAREVGLMRDGTGAIPATFVGSASGIHFIRSVYGAIGSPTAANTSPEANLVPGEDDQLSRAAKSIWHEHEITTDETLQPTFDQLIAWSTSYFDSWHPAFPFLHAPTLLKSFEMISQGRRSAIQHWDMVMVKTVMSLSLADQRQSGQRSTPVPQSLLFQTFDETLHSIQPAMVHPATLLSVQAVMSVQLFLVSMLRLNTAARLGGLIVQLLFQLGLHRCPMRYKSFSLEERQLRKRIWWSAYVIERYTCQALGLPLLIHDADVDVCHLNNESHALEIVSGVAPTKSFDARMQLLVFLASHAQLRGSIMELRNKKIEERDRDPEAAIYLTARIAEWWNGIEDLLDQPDHAISPLHETILEMLRHESIIMLNRPLLALPKSTANHASAVQACISAAKALLSVLSSLQTMVGNVRPALVWPSFTWAAWMSGFVILYAAAEGKVPITVASRNVDKSLKILEALAVRGSVWPQACAVAIEDLRNTLMERQDGKRMDGVSAAPATRRDQPEQVHEAAHESRSSLGLATPRSQVQDHNTNHARSSSDTRLSSAQPRREHRPSAPYDMSHNPEVPHSVSLDAAACHINAQPGLSLDHTWLDPTIFYHEAQPMFSDSDPLQGFEIPFWMGADNTLAWMNNNNM